MPITLADRVKETAASPGTGNLALLGPVSDFISFSAGVGVGNDCYYEIDDGVSLWEVGRGTLSSASLLTRSAGNVKSGSLGAGALVNFAGGVTVSACAASEYVINARSSIFNKVTPGEPINVRDCVYISVEDGRAYRANATMPRAAPFARHMGFAIESFGIVGSLSSSSKSSPKSSSVKSSSARSSSSSPSGQQANPPIWVQSLGVVSGFRGLTAGAVEYASTVSGGITESPLTITPVPVGIAVSSSQLLINTQGNRFALTYLIGNKGYFVGGDTGAGTPLADCDAFTIATEAIATTASGNLTSARTNGSTLQEGSWKGYFAGGGTNVGGGQTNTIDRITYSNDTTASSTATLSQSRIAAGEGSLFGVKGYISGGATGGAAPVTTTDRMNFSSDTVSALSSANLATVTSNMGSCSDNGTKAYMAGGISSVSGFLTTVNGIFFAIDVMATLTTVLNLARSELSGCATDYGWTNNWSLAGVYRKGFFMGGRTIGGGGLTTTIDKITFATDTVNATTKTLQVARASSGGIGGGSANGYISSGNVAGGITNSMERLAFANEVTTALTAVGTNKKQFPYDLGQI